MTEKELKKLNRYQLLELIILQTEQMDSLRQELADTQKALEEKTVRLSSAGSIAEASLQLSGIFEAAQTAANIYLDSIKVQTENSAQIEADARDRAQTIIAEAENKAGTMLEDANQKSQAMLKDANQKSEAMLEDARQKSDATLAAARADAEVIHAEAESRMSEMLRKCEEREQAVSESIQKIRDAFQSQCMNLDTLTQSGAETK